MLLYMSTLCSTSFQCGCLRYFFTGLRSINNLSIQLEKKKKDLSSLNLWWFSGGLYFLHHGSQQGTHSTSQHSKLQMLHEDTKCQKIVFPMCIYISYILVYHFRSGKLNPSCKVCFEPTTMQDIDHQPSVPPPGIFLWFTGIVQCMATSVACFQQSVYYCTSQYTA